MATQKKAVTKKTVKKIESSITAKPQAIPATKESILKRFTRAQLIVGGIMLFVVALYLLRGLFIVAVVNGKPIWRLSVVSQLEKESGKQILDQLITTSLIFQEASRQGVSVSNQEVSERIKKIEDSLSAQGQTLDSVLTLQGMNRAKLAEQITMQLLLEKMLGKKITVADKEINDYIEQNKGLLPENKSGDELRTQVKEQLRQQKLNEKFQEWITDLQKKAKIFYVVQY